MAYLMKYFVICIFRVTDDSCGLLLKKYEDSYAAIVDSMEENNGRRTVILFIHAVKKFLL